MSRCDATGGYEVTWTLDGGTVTCQARTTDDQHDLGTQSPQRRVLLS